MQLDLKDLRMLQCPSCGVGYAIPARVYEANQSGSSKNGWYCPNGHHLTFNETEADRIRQDRDRLKQRLAEKDDEIRRQSEWREQAERTASAYKGQVTRLKNRSKAGLCPCCNRHFTNLERHMATKHPDMDPAEPLQIIEGGKA